ncbi:MAG: amino acid ABC transporter permease [Chloroflexota bacterium]
MTANKPAPTEVQPPSTEVGALGWLRHNLFNSVPSAIATIIVLVILVLATIAIAEWVLQARWGVITTNMRLFLVGRYPQDQIWRVATTMSVLSLLSGLSAGTWHSGAVRSMAIMLTAGQLALAVLVFMSGLGLVAVAVLIANAMLTYGSMLLASRWPVPRRWLLIGWAASLVLMTFLLYGISEGTPLPPVGSDVWGGLLVTILLAVAAILLSLPIGIALALGRRSRLPVVRILSTAYIELIRAVPLITILFAAALLLPLFLPGDVRIDRVIRAVGGLTIFTSAYVAENVRGGLQAIPVGQIEAAQSVGLKGYQVNLYVVLPQALRISIPANVGQFISLLKDTTLVFIISLLEILGIGRKVLGQPEWLGANFEVYVFVGAVFFVLSYALSRASYRLEEELGEGKR